MNAEVYMVKGLSFLGKAGSGHWLAMDGPSEFGGTEAASKPLELFLIGLAGCTGMDVVSLLRKKRAPLTAFRIEVEALRAEDPPRVFTEISLTYYLQGEGLRERDVEEAIKLSREKYCAAAAMLSQACVLTYRYELK